MEGVAFSLRDTFTLFAELGIPVQRIRLGGGGARSPLWQQIQADVYGHTVEVLAAEEGGAFGAALLAGVGAGAWPTVEAACAETVEVAQEVTPKSSPQMSEAYQRFRRIYPALKEIGRN
jgi:xylulokinase